MVHIQGFLVQVSLFSLSLLLYQFHTSPPSPHLLSLHLISASPLSLFLSFFPPRFRPDSAGKTAQIPPEKHQLLHLTASPRVLHRLFFVNYTSSTNLKTRSETRCSSLVVLRRLFFLLRRLVLSFFLLRRLFVLSKIES